MAVHNAAVAASPAQPQPGLDPGRAPVQALVRAWNVAEARTVWTAPTSVDLSRAPPHFVVEGGLRFDCSREAVRVVPLEDDTWLTPYEFPLGAADWLPPDWTARDPNARWTAGDPNQRFLPAGWTFDVKSGRARGPNGESWEFPWTGKFALDGLTLAYIPAGYSINGSRICIMTVPNSEDDWCLSQSEVSPDTLYPGHISDVACDGGRVLVLCLPWMSLIDAKSGTILWRRNLALDVPPVREAAGRGGGFRWYAASCAIAGEFCFVHAHTYAFAVRAADGRLDYWMDFGGAAQVPSLLRGSGPLFLFTPQEFLVDRGGLSWREGAEPR